MLLTVIAYAMIIVFMYVIMTKKLSPFTSLVMIPLLFAIIAMVAGVAKKGTIGDFVLKGLTTTANTGSCSYSLFCIFPLCSTPVCSIRLQPG